MKKALAVIIPLVLILTTLFFSSCTHSGPTVAIPDDPTNCARALLLMEDLGYITLPDSSGVNVSVKDIEDNPYDLYFKEVSASKLPDYLNRADYAVINSNYAIAAGIDPTKNALAIETASSEYSNILAVRGEDEFAPKTRALAAALKSKKTADYIRSAYDGAVISIAETLTDGYDSTLDYSELKGETITVAASPTPHAEILKIAEEILKEKQITLEILEYTDYTEPNKIVAEGKADANYFQHLPYLQNYNEQNGTDLISVSAVHVEPMGLYGGRQTSLESLQ